MAIQGIINGYGHPQDPDINVLLVGRGPQYLLFQNGSPVEGGARTDLRDAYLAFDALAKQACAPEWLSVRAIASNNVNAQCQVTEFGDRTFAQYAYFQMDDAGILRTVGAVKGATPQEMEEECLPGATPREVGFVYMQDVVGDYADMAKVAEWDWLEQHAAMKHANNSREGTAPFYELILGLEFGQDFSSAPESLQKVLAEAREKFFIYVIFAHRPAAGTAQ